MVKRKKQWSELSLMQRTAIVKLSVLDVGLKCWALADLVDRPQNQVKGAKAAWAIALTVVNSVGVLPGIYLAWGRRAA